MQVYWKGSVCKHNIKIQVNCVQSCNLLSGMCTNVLSPIKWQTRKEQLRNRSEYYNNFEDMSEFM